MEAWDKRDSETRKAHNAFIAYRDMLPSPSLRQLAAQLGYKSVTTVSRWSKKHDWQDRVEAWAAHQRAEHERVIAEQFAEDRQQARQRRQNTVQALQGLLFRVMDAHQSSLDPHTLNQLSNAAKTIMSESRAEYNDLPTHRTATDVTSGGVPLSEKTLLIMARMGIQVEDVAAEFERMIQEAAGE